MASDPTKTLSYHLGELKAQMSAVLKDTSEIKELCAALEPRITSLEQTRFKVYTIIATVGAFMGLLGSQIGKALEWLKESLTA